ncbi:hypothetical protein NSU_3046 [Novosphingobium pentaromativorans US6-1]|uniref:Uncharacterized protein n=1 Tax=Novosphingobium pentaromativorans US6-1 TaxID=1088721 RepID=G6EFC5_9SPHN|nr:hypothetical protein NSU_3046 [Novosphingobium pentaromativorans US6-1]
MVDGSALATDRFTMLQDVFGAARRREISLFHHMPSEAIR